MIQRIQSVYLFLAGLVLAFTFCMPLVNFSNAEGAAGTMYAATIVGADGNVVSHPFGVLTFTIVSILLAFATIFLYKNRRRQIMMTNILLVLILLVYVTVIAYSMAFNAKHDATMAGSYGAIFPLASYVLGWLARRAIRKDEELIRSTERFR